MFFESKFQEVLWLILYCSVSLVQWRSPALPKGPSRSPLPYPTFEGALQHIPWDYVQMLRYSQSSELKGSCGFCVLHFSPK